MIQYINILTRDGKSLLFRNYGTSEVDRDLLAGFLSAFSGFMKKINQSDIESTQTEDFKYFYTIIDTIIIVVCTDLEDDDSTVNSKILSIRTRFIEPYCFSCGSTDLRNPSFIESRHISFFAYVCRRCGAIIRRDKPITKHQKRKTRKARKIRYKKKKKRSKKNS